MLGATFSLSTESKKHRKKTMNQQSYNLYLGKKGVKDFAQYNLGCTDNHSSGAGFRKLDFLLPNLGKIKVENGANRLVIDHIFSVLGTSFNTEVFVNPEQAYKAYVGLMKRIN
jgi:hypothetical protein